MELGEREDTPLTVEESIKPDKLLSSDDLAEMGVSLEEFMGGSIDYAAREGARIILEVALAEEIDGFLGRTAYQRAEPDQSGYRNGGWQRTLWCGSGKNQPQTKTKPK